MVKSVKSLMSCWIVVVSKNHVQKGVTGGFMQACHGKAGPIKRLKKGDLLVCYSPKIEFGKNEPCQKFTAIGKIKDDEIYQFKMSEDFVPYRRNVEFYDCSEASIVPLIEHLSFITNKKHWGAPFRYGLLKIPKEDFLLIAKVMDPNSKID